MKTLSRNELKSLQGGKMFGQGWNGYNPSTCQFTNVAGNANEVICACDWSWCHFDFWIPNNCNVQSVSTAPSACFANGSSLG